MYGSATNRNTKKCQRKIWKNAWSKTILLYVIRENLVSWSLKPQWWNTSIHGRSHMLYESMIYVVHCTTHINWCDFLLRLHIPFLDFVHLSCLAIVSLGRAMANVTVKKKRKQKWRWWCWLRNCRHIWLATCCWKEIAVCLFVNKKSNWIISIYSIEHQYRNELFRNESYPHNGVRVRTRTTFTNQ